jgi:hypothetical protein
LRARQCGRPRSLSSRRHALYQRKLVHHVRGHNRFEQVRVGPLGFAFACRAQQGHAGLCQVVFEGSSVVVLVADQGLPGPLGQQIGLVVEDGQQCLAFVGLGAGECERDRQPAQCGDQVQA